MSPVAGGGDFRVVIAELWNEVVVVRRLMPDDPDPSEAELASLAEAYRLSASGYDARTRELEQANGGVPVTCRVVAHATAGPWALILNDEQTQALAGLP